MIWPYLSIVNINNSSSTMTPTTRAILRFSSETRPIKSGARVVLAGCVIRYDADAACGSQQSTSAFTFYNFCHLWLFEIQGYSIVDVLIDFKCKYKLVSHVDLILNCRSAKLRNVANLYATRQRRTKKLVGSQLVEFVHCSIFFSSLEFLPFTRLTLNTTITV